MNQNISLNRKVILNSNKIFCSCIAFYYALSVLNRVFASLLKGSFILASIIRFGTYAVIILVLLGMIGNFKRLVTLITLEVVVAIIFILSVATGNIGNTEWQPVYEQIATTYIPLGIAAYCITDRKMLLNAIYPVALVSVPILIAVAVLSYGNWEYSYDMSLGYVMVFSVLVLMAQFTVDTKIYNIALAGCLSVFILLVGSRGPFICIIAFIMIELLLSPRYSKKTKTVIIILVVSAAVVLWINMDKILSYIYQISVSLGFDSRSVLLLIQGEALSHDSGRNVLNEYYMELINRKPILGYGVMGGWVSDDMYPHNIILELTLSFGYPLGGFLLIALLLILVSAIRKKNDKYNNALIVLFVSYCMYLFVSNTYLKVWQFFVCIALCIPNSKLIQWREQIYGKSEKRKLKKEKTRIKIKI